MRKGCGPGAQPLEWLDRMLAFWRRSTLARFAAMPLGYLSGTPFSPPEILRALVRWSPLSLALCALLAARLESR